MEQSKSDELLAVKRVLRNAFPKAFCAERWQYTREMFEQMRCELPRCLASDVVRVLPVVLDDLLEHHSDSENDYADQVVFFLTPPMASETQFAIDRAEIERLNAEAGLALDPVTINALTTPLPGPVSPYNMSDFESYFELFDDAGARAIQRWLRLAQSWQSLDYVATELSRALQYWTSRVGGTD